MRKGAAELNKGNIAFNVANLNVLQEEGFNFVQVKGLTQDMHYEYVDFHFLVLVPYRELPTDPMKKGIYEPIKSELLYKWAAEKNDDPEIIIAFNEGIRQAIH